MNKKTISVILGGLIVGFLVLLLFRSSSDRTDTLGGTASGLPADLATSSTVSVGEAISVLFATTSAPSLCANRVVSTVGNPILIQFSPGINKNSYGTTSLQLGFGYLQSASTTISYSGESFGCGAWIVTDVGGSTTTIGISEFR